MQNVHKTCTFRIMYIELFVDFLQYIENVFCIILEICLSISVSVFLGHSLSLKI